MANEKLVRYMTTRSSLSRRACMQHLQDGEVWVNDEVVTDAGMMIGPNDRVHLDGYVFEESLTYYYFKFHKPKGVITSMSDPKGRACMAPYLLDYPDSLVPVGRLDRQSSGLLLVTNDGVFSNQVLHPNFHVPKTYYVQLDRALSKEDEQRLLMGIILEDGPVQFLSLELIAPNQYKVIVDQGRYRMIRRALLFLRYRVQTLIRTAIGSVQLDRLAVGKMKRLTKQERLSLLK